MIRTILRRIRRRPATDWLPLPYDQAIALPAPEPIDYSLMLTKDGKRFLALQPLPRSGVPLRRRRSERAKAVRMMDWPAGW